MTADAAEPKTADRGALAPMEVATRSERLRESVGAAGLDGLLVSNLTNIRYLTGFTGSSGLLLLSGTGLLLLTDGRYGEQATAQLAAAGVDATIEVSASQREPLSAAVSAAGIARLGLEATAVTWADQRDYAATWFPTVELVATDGLVEAQRVVKDDGEVDRIATAAAIADSAFAQVRHMLGEGPTEAEFAIELDMAMRRLGAEGVSFETIVASGPSAALPHHRPDDRRVRDGDLVVVDFGALLDGYHSDMTRTVMIGEPTAVGQRMYDVVLQAQAAGVAAVSAGVAAAEVDSAARAVIDAAGWADAFLHGTGHGIGLDIHEEPRVGQRSTARLVDRCVVTVEPGVYLPDHGGVRIEDTVLVTADGCRPLTLTDKLAAV